jgi:hypothetical protein
MNGRLSPTEDVEGLVEAVNSKGLKLGGSWVNVSQFRPVELPEAGARVRMKIDSKGYIVALENLSDAPSTPAVRSSSEKSEKREERITRLAVLKAAATFCGGRAVSNEVSSSDVLKIAEAWLKWVETKR